MDIVLGPNATLPTKAHPNDAGYDLYASAEGIINPGSCFSIPTDIKITVPIGTYGRIAPRSGLASKFGIDVMAGVIDHEYTGFVRVMLINHGEFPYEFKKGDKIAQLIIEEIRQVELNIVDKLNETSRGEGGFGSSGR